MNVAKNAGFKKSIPFSAGIFTGIFIVMMLCLIFSNILYSIIPKIQLPMKLFAAAYMVFLIIKTVMPQKEHAVKNNRGTFIAGALLQLVNPKLIIYGITAMSSFIIPYFNETPVFILFALLLAFVSVTATLCWALFGSLFTVLFSRHGKLLNIIMAILLLYCAVSLFI
jgi:threonine/homoserine/homoserine lactone efflux protein